MAATLATPAQQVDSIEPEILTDDQVEKLLQEAENRLRQQAGLVNDPEKDTISFNEEPSTRTKRIQLPNLEHTANKSSYIRTSDGVAKADPKSMVPAEQRKMAGGLRKIQTQRTRNSKVNDQTDAGPDWFHLPKTVLTTELKRDLQLIEMRNVLDPHRHYKKNTRKGKIPTFSQVGTVVEGPTEWYSSRLNRKDRSKNFVEEEMRNERDTGRFKRKYNEIQDTKTSGKKAHYKKLLAKRKRKT